MSDILADAEALSAYAARGGAVVSEADRSTVARHFYRAARPVVLIQTLASPEAPALERFQERFHEQFRRAANAPLHITARWERYPFNRFTSNSANFAAACLIYKVHNLGFAAYKISGSSRAHMTSQTAFTSPVAFRPVEVRLVFRINAPETIADLLTNKTLLLANLRRLSVSITLCLRYLGAPGFQCGISQT
ncbi:hypothetical protein B0H19DRAFT_1377054 [Mycena capillaripes]|nr:hypothetical protein B0H19DRAFT_1377054 [Mycena capillaripes]